MTKSLVIFGAGGHAKVVAEAAQLCGFDILGFVDQSPNRWGAELLGIPVVGDETDLTSFDNEDCRAVVAIGDNAQREALVNRLAERNVKFARVIHPSALISPSAELGTGTVVLAGTVVNSMAVLGNHCILNTMSSIDHDCVIEDFVHLSPGVHLAGGCHVGRSAHVGISACVVPHCCIGARSIIGAGAAVTQNIPSDVTAVGVPARVLA